MSSLSSLSSSPPVRLVMQRAEQLKEREAMLAAMTDEERTAFLKQEGLPLAALGLFPCRLCDSP